MASNLNSIFSHEQFKHGDFPVNSSSFFGSLPDGKPGAKLRPHPQSSPQMILAPGQKQSQR